VQNTITFRSEGLASKTVHFHGIKAGGRLERTKMKKCDSDGQYQALREAENDFNTRVSFSNIFQSLMLFKRSKLHLQHPTFGRQTNKKDTRVLPLRRRSPNIFLYPLGSSDWIECLLMTNGRTQIGCD
jgi:hypothetical protein